MNTSTGELYPSYQAAKRAGIPDRDLVQVRGTDKAIRRLQRRVRMVSKHVNARRKARRDLQKQSRKANR